MDGEIIEVTETPPKLAKTKAHSIEAIVDRIAIREGIRPRLAESLDLALEALRRLESWRSWIRRTAGKNSC